MFRARTEISFESTSSMATTEIQNTGDENETSLKHEKLPNETLETVSIFDEHLLLDNNLDETQNPSSSSMQQQQQQQPSSSGAGLIDPQRKEAEESKENGNPCVEANAGSSSFTPVSYLQRKMRHAERFGISEEEKRYSRTERFRGPNMSIEEDVALCKAYISIAEDPVMGSELKKEKFWERVFDAFVQLISNVNHRNATTLCNRFGVISKDVRHYVEKLAEVENRRQSGWTDVDMMRKARTEFQTTYRKSFQFEECHQILKAIPKYSVIAIAAKMKNTCLSQKEGGTSSPSTPITNICNMNHSESPVDVEGPFEKLAERKTEKKKARTKAKEPDNYMSILEEIVSFNLFFKENALQKKAQKDLSNDNMAQFLQIKLREVEDRVMAMDLSTVSGPQRVYFEQRQKEVLARHGISTL